MKTRIHLLLASLAGLATTASNAQTAAPAPAASSGVAFTASASVVSEYMFRGQRLNGAGFQPSIEMTAGNLTAGLWTNFVLDDKVPDSSDPEIDLYGSYTFSLGKDLTLVPGATVYYYPSAPTSAGYYRTSFEPSLALNYTIEGVKLTPKAYYDMTLEGATYEFTAAYAIPLKDIGSELGLTATVGTYLYKEFANHTSPSVKAWGDYWLVGVTMPFQLDKNSKLSVGFAYTEGRDAFTKQGSSGRAPNSLALGRGVVTVAYALSF
jgi:uncharacterized protein (TIGR02001 family)